MRELTPKQLRKECALSLFDFETTEELSDLRNVIGQRRAMGALEFAANIGNDGYNVYVMGQVGTGRSSSSRNFLVARAKQEPVSDDWCYVYNFADPRVPKAVNLPAGHGVEWQATMQKVTRELLSQVMGAFESDEYNEKRDDILRSFREERNLELQEFERVVEEAGFTLGRSPAGLIVAPAANGEVMDPQEYRKLTEEQRKALEDKRQELQGMLAEIMRRGQREEKLTRQQVQALDREIARTVIEPLLEEIREKNRDYEAVLRHIDDVENDLLENISRVRQATEDGDGQTQTPFGPQGSSAGAVPMMDRYQVNVLINNAELEGAPVIFEANPTLEGLTGEVEHQTQMGALVTDFTMIKPGALHKANGGYLLLEVHQLLTRPYAWDALKRAIKNEHIRIESLRDQYRFISTVSLEPEPIPLQVKVVLIGNPMLYYLLYEYDEDFRKLFKVKADFDSQVPRTAATSRQYAALVGEICRREKLAHFSPEAVAKIVEHGSRLAGDQRKLSLNFSTISNLVKESAYWASTAKHEIVGAEDVAEALSQQIYRSSRIEERLTEMIADGTIMVDVKGEKTGQINGLAVIQLGDYMMGKPSRLTCRTFPGRSGVVNLDRDAKMTGRIHDKGLLTITGFLGERFAQETPLSLSGHISFEQLYEQLDGDSASSTELYALLSSIAGVPIRQGIAVTGSVNQLGEVQAIGGVNAKIEGYYAVCKAIGLTGEQGVIIPEANRPHLMLNDEVINAVESGKFHVWSVKHIDEGIEILTGIKAGRRGKSGRYPKGTINARVQARLDEFADTLKTSGKPENNNSKAEESGKTNNNKEE